MAKLESLIVEMQLESAELRKGLDEVKKKLEETAKHAEGLFNFEVLKEVGHLALEAAEKLGEFVLESAEAADHMGKLAAASQVGVEDFQRLAYAAKLGGVSAEDLGGAFNKLNKALSEALEGSSSQVALFKALGVSLKDASGNARSSSDIFRELAGKLSEMGPGYAKARLEQELFGKSGTALDTALKDVAEGLADAGGEADRFGLVLSGKSIAAITEFNDNITKVKTALSGIGQRVAADLAPAMEELTKQLVTSKDGANGLKGAAEVLANVIRVVASVVIPLVGAFRAMGAVIAGVAAQAVALFNRDFRGAAAIADDIAAQLGKIASETADQVAAVWKTSGEEMGKGAETTAGAAEKVIKAHKDLEQAAKDAEKAEKELAKFLEDTLKAARDVNLELAKNQRSLGLTVGGINSAADTKRQAFQDVGADPSAILKRITAGFSDFDDALKKATNNEIWQAEKLAEAKAAEIHGAYADANAALEQAAMFGEGAKAAHAAADAFSKIKEMLRADVNTVDGALHALGSAVLQAVPRLNQLVQAAQQGGAVGGVWGALIAVFVQLASQTQGFKDILAIVDENLDQLIGALEPLINAFSSIMKALDPITKVITDLVGGALGPIAGLLKSLVPLFQAIGNLLGTIGSAGQSGFGIVMNTLKPIFEILKFIGTLLKLLAPILKLVMIPLELVGRLFQGLTDLLNPVFEAIDVAISWLGNRIDEFAEWISHLGERIENFVKGKGFVTNAEEKSKNDVTADGSDKRGVTVRDEGLGSEGITRDSIGAVEDLGTAAKTTTKHLEKLSEAFANVPEGFKARLRQFQSADPAIPGNQMETLEAQSINITVNGSLVHENQLIEMINNSNRRQKFQRTGRP
jgi:phage-related protein